MSPWIRRVKGGGEGEYGELTKSLYLIQLLLALLGPLFNEASTLAHTNYRLSTQMILSTPLSLFW